jgi:DNA-directed RNA polymerase sigma subunit (sigma70/sigma32)
MNLETDSFIRALGELDGALDENIERAKVMKRRIKQIQRQRANGLSYKEIVESKEGPLIVQLLTESGRALDHHGAKVRRTEALALHQEGMTMEQIAAGFGVTRQRVSALLREARADPR